MHALPCRRYLVVLIGLLGINWLLNFTSDWVKIGVIALGYGAVIGACKLLGLSLKDLGLSRSHIKSGLQWGLVSAGIIAVVAIIAFFIHPSLFLDSRYTYNLSQTVYKIFIVLPFQTVLLEELAFRGMIFGELSRTLSQKAAMLWAALLFGVWHILSARQIGHSISAIASITHGHFVQLLGIIGAVIATSVAGYIFVWFRTKSQSLLAPIIVHWALNATGVVLAVLAAKQ